MTCCVIFDGPYPEQDRWGDEFPTWIVFAADEEGEPTGKTYTVHSFGKAQALAEKMANERHLELVTDASPA